MTLDVAAAAFLVNHSKCDSIISKKTIMASAVSAAPTASALPAPPSVPRTNSLSFSISRLLEKAGHQPESQPIKSSQDVGIIKPEAIIRKKSISEEVDDSHSCASSTSSVEVDAVGSDGEELADADDGGDVKVNDSDDEEEENNSSSAGIMMSNRNLLDYSGGGAPHPHQQHAGIDWYALYALQQHSAATGGGMFPHHPPPHHHLLPPGYRHHPGAVSSSGGQQPNNPPPSSGGYGSYNSSSGGPPPPPGFPSLPPGSGQQPDYQQHPAGGIPNAFAALLEATVFKDRLAAGIYNRLLKFDLNYLWVILELFYSDQRAFNNEVG